MALTPRQREVLATLQTLIEERGESPTIRQLCEQLDRTSTSTIHRQLRVLEQKGYIATRVVPRHIEYAIVRRPRESAA